jgi:hypothetical protein
VAGQELLMEAERAVAAVAAAEHTPPVAVVDFDNQIGLVELWDFQRQLAAAVAAVAAPVVVEGVEYAAAAAAAVVVVAVAVAVVAAAVGVAGE